MAGPFPGRPAMGRYTLLPSASNWASVSEEAENVAPVVEGTLHFVLFHALLYFLLVTSFRVPFRSTIKLLLFTVSLPKILI